jgi:hypothetical protein
LSTTAPGKASFTRASIAPKSMLAMLLSLESYGQAAS